MIWYSKAADPAARFPSSKTWHVMDVGNGKVIKLTCQTNTGVEFYLSATHSQLTAVQIGN